MLKALQLLFCLGAAGALRRPEDTNHHHKVTKLRKKERDTAAHLIREDIKQVSPSCLIRRFGSTPYLQGVQFMETRTEHLPFDDFDHGSGNKEGLLVYPKSRVAMCIIEKNGCSTWTTLFNKLTRNMPHIKSAWYGVVPFHWSPENASKVFSDETSTRIVWVRDPLERFLSGFLDKCAVFHDHNYYHICSFHWTRKQAPGFPLSQVMKWFMAGHHAREMDSHFTPQAWHCELHRRLQEYNLIGLMTRADFAKDATCILEQANLSRVNVNEVGAPYLVTARARDWKAQERQRIAVMKKFFTKEFARFLLDVYKEDYDLFRLQRPSWIEEATGEWYDILPNATGAMQRRTAELMQDHLGSQESSWTSVSNNDDIVELAKRAGFELEREERINL